MEKTMTLGYILHDWAHEMFLHKLKTIHMLRNLDAFLFFGHKNKTTRREHGQQSLYK